MFVVSTLIHQCRNQFIEFIESVFHLALSILVKSVCYQQPIYLCLSGLRQGPIFSGASLEGVLCCFQACITASLDLMSLHCSTRKQKIFFFSVFLLFSDQHISWLYEYWWLLPVPCHLRCCQENPEKGEDNIQSPKIEPLRKKTCTTGLAFFFYSVWWWMIDIDFNMSATEG